MNAIPLLGYHFREKMTEGNEKAYMSIDPPIPLIQQHPAHRPTWLPYIFSFYPLTIEIFIILG
jgi:hypothetical protein